MTDYDLFAPFYDATMGDRQDVIGIVASLIRKHHPTTQSVLELGCGTGQILAGLSNVYQLSGLDQSAKMLELAQQKLPSAHLYQGNISTFNLPERYDAIFCVFDTINHLTSFAQWQSCFQQTASHLNPGGLFIFDMNTIHRMQILAKVGSYTQSFEGKTVDIDIEPDAKNQVTWHLTIQDPAPDGTIQVYEEHVPETSFDLAKVESALHTSGFTVLEQFDSDRRTPSASSDRIYFACQRAK
jgi:SAM-dependent methyltransferase